MENKLLEQKLDIIYMSKLLRISPVTLTRKAATGYLGATKVKGRWMFDREEVEKLLVS